MRIRLFACLIALFSMAPAAQAQGNLLPACLDAALTVSSLPGCSRSQLTRRARRNSFVRARPFAPMRRRATRCNHL